AKNKKVFEELAMQDRLFEQAKETLYFLSHHPEELAAYTQRLKYLLDTASRLDDARTEGKAEGIQIGEHKKALETAKKLKARDFSMIDIIDMTGLSPEEVENL
ncbi:MAG: hypothetical protein DCC88_05390, partial [Spirobacillus cienkowskii]